MKRIEVILILTLGLCLIGCHKPGVKYSDIHIAPTAAIVSGVVTIQLNGSYLGSDTWAHAKSRFEGQTLCIYAYPAKSEPEPDHEYVVKLPSSLSADSVKVIWLDPDGSQVPIPTTK